MKKITKMDIANSFFAGEGSNGIRVIPFQTEHDSQGTDENVEGMDNRTLLASAWRETRGNFRFDETTKSWVVKRTKGTGLGETTEAIIKEEATRLDEDEMFIEGTGQAEASHPLLKGCLVDYLAEMGEPIHPNWVAWTQGDEKAVAEDEGLIETVMDRRDEVMQEREDKVKPKLELVNWLHIERIEEMRVQIVSAVERIIDRQHKARDIKGLRNTLSIIHKKRDESFCQKTLTEYMYRDEILKGKDGKVPSDLRDLRNSFLFMGKAAALKAKGQKFDPLKHLTPREKKVYFMYTESRKLTFEQHKYLKGYTETLISLLESVERGSKVKVTLEVKEEKRDILTVKPPSDEQIERIYILSEYSEMTCDLAYYRLFYKEAMQAKDREWVMWALEKGIALKARIKAYEEEYKVSEKDLDPA